MSTLTVQAQADCTCTASPDWHRWSLVCRKSHFCIRWAAVKSVLDQKMQKCKSLNYKHEIFQYVFKLNINT